LFSVTRVSQPEFEVPEEFPVVEYLKGDTMTVTEESHNGNISEVVETWNGKGISLLLMRDTILGVKSIHSPKIGL
jgi:hypothetical protein